MADNSNFVLRWEIDRSVFTTGKADPKVFNVGGFKWTAEVERDSDLAKFSLRCGVDNKRFWKCESEVYFTSFGNDGSFWKRDKKFVFDENKQSFLHPVDWEWSRFNHPNLINNNMVTVEFNVHIISSERCEILRESIADLEAKFAAQSKRSPVVLKIGEKKLHVSKEYLAAQSPFFENLFFGNFVENGKEEVEIKGVVYEEFLDLLSVVYLEMEISYHTMPHILKLADFFEMKRVLDLAQKHLIQSNGIDAVQKLIMADQYRLADLRVRCLNSFSTLAELNEKLKPFPEAANFTDETKVAIYDRFMKLQMADNSNFVLRWEIANATAVQAAGRLDPKVFKEGGFRWTANIERNPGSYADLSLKCGVEHKRPWKCEANVGLWLFCSNGTNGVYMTNQKCVFDDNNSVTCPNLIFWSHLTHPSFNVNDTVTMEFHIEITDADRGLPTRPGKFATPNNKSNVILKIGNKKLHVSKEYLAIHSPVFDALFFGKFAETGKKEVEIKDVVYEEFIDLLNVIYMENVKISDRTAMHLLKLADQFQLERLLDMSKNYIMLSKGIDPVQKLLISEKYRLPELRDQCLKSFCNITELHNILKFSPDHAKLSDEIKLAIYDRFMQL